MVLDFLAHRCHGFVEDRLNKRHAASTSCSGLCAGLYVADGLARTILDTLHHITLGDIVARANLHIVVEIGTIIVTLLGTDDELTWWHVQLLLVFHHRHQLHIVFRVANHHTTEQVFPIHRE